MTKIIVVKVIIKIDIDQIVEIGHHSEVEVSTDRTIEEDLDMLIITEIILGEINSEIHKVIEVKV